MTAHPTPVFVYGTLTDASQAEALLDEWWFDGEAVLDGLERVDGRYPTLAPGGSTAGRLLVTPELDRLDAYEGVDRGLYLRASVPMAGGDRAWLYVGDPDRLDAPADWPGTGSFVDRVRAYLDVEAVQVRRAGNR